MLKYPNGFLYRYISYNSKFMEACEIYGGLLLLGLTSKKHQEYARNQHAPKKNMEHHSWIPFSFSFLCLSLSISFMFWQYLTVSISFQNVPAACWSFQPSGNHLNK